MAFGNSLSQNRLEDCKYPNPNNFCGGFALNAVLAEITPKFNNPMTVYCKIQEYQNTDVLPGCKTYDFLHNPTYIQNGTLMSLPSGICAAFKNYVTDRTVTVCYNSNLKNIFGVDIITEESGRITGERLGMKIQEEETLSPGDWSYILVLVNKRHWIAVKRIEEGKNFTCYDPANGNAKTGDSMTAAIQEFGYTPESISGLYICIPKTI